MASLSLEGINRGRTYEIEYFFEPAEDGTRHVKFVDLTEPVAIGISSLNNFSIKSRSKKIGTVESVEIDGAQIGIGTRFFSSNRYDFLNLAERHHYTIAGIRVDEDGDISVIIDGFDQPVYITYDGGKLHPSIKFLIPRFTGGTLSYSETSLSVGQSVKIDGRAVRVENIAQVGTEYQASFSGDDEPRTVLSNGEWQIRFTEFTFEYTDSKVIFDENSLEFGQSDHLLVTGAETPLALGGLYRILGITPNQDDNAQPFDLDIILEYANEPIPVIREGKWVFAGLEPVRLSYKAAGDTLVRGTKLRAINDKIGGVFCGDVFEIHCFGNTLEYPEIQEIIFTDGQSIPFSKQTLKSFEYCPDGNDFKGIPSHVCSDLPQISFNLRRDHRYKQGDRVKYIGSDTGRFSGLLGTIHRDSDGYDARVVFDKFKDEGHRGVMCGNIKAVAFPLKIGFKFVSLELFEGGLAFRRHDGSITPCPAELVAECKGAKGEVVAKDIHGQDIRLGDFVCLQRAGYPDGKGAPGIVINRERDRWHGDYFHVFYGRDVSGGSFSQTSRWDIRFNNQAMKKQVDMVFIKNCERLDVVSVPTPEPTELEVGDFVRVKDGVTPSCGWAGVSPDEVGRIIEIDEGDAVVDFAGNNEWIGSLDEFEIVDQPLAVGDSVRVRRDVTPHYGWGLASSEHSGRVKNVVNGVVVIDFPHHPDWSAKRSDVEYTPKRSST